MEGKVDSLQGTEFRHESPVTELDGFSIVHSIFSLVICVIDEQGTEHQGRVLLDNQ